MQIYNVYLTRVLNSQLASGRVRHFVGVVDAHMKVGISLLTAGGDDTGGCGMC